MQFVICVSILTVLYLCARWCASQIISATTISCLCYQISHVWDSIIMMLRILLYTVYTCEERTYIQPTRRTLKTNPIYAIYANCAVWSFLPLLCSNTTLRFDPSTHFLCALCQQVLLIRHELRHTRLCADPSSFRCTHCPHVSRRKDNMKEHMLRVHKL